MANCEADFRGFKLRLHPESLLLELLYSMQRVGRILECCNFCLLQGLALQPLQLWFGVVQQLVRFLDWLLHLLAFLTNVLQYKESPSACPRSLSWEHSYCAQAKYRPCSRSLDVLCLESGCQAESMLHNVAGKCRLWDCNLKDRLTTGTNSYLTPDGRDRYSLSFTFSWSGTTRREGCETKARKEKLGVRSSSTTHT